MAMSAYYLKGIAPPEIRLTQIFSGVMPFLFCVFIAMGLLYAYPQIVFYLPELMLRLKFQVQHPEPTGHRMLRWTDEASTSAARNVA
jgi:membrane-anchored protein YejM (alkaline phosphatase superfamily)